MGNICRRIQQSTRVQQVSRAEPDMAEHKKGEHEQSNDLTTVCQLDDLPENELKVFEVKGTSVLLVKEEGQIYAMGNKCTHYGAPLNTGIFCKGKIYCPWHGACFNAKTGDIEEFPGIDPIPAYATQIDQTTNEIKINLTANNKQKGNSFTKPLSKSDDANENIVVIIGSGAAGHSCAETLRQEGFTGRILMLTKEDFLPYDRPKLSKVMNIDGNKIVLRSKEYYEKGDIDVVQKVTVESVDPETKTLVLRSGEVLSYTYLVIATGGRPRPLPCPGTHLTNVCLLRTPTDANYIAEHAKDCHVIIVGTSFIGMEAAAYLVDSAASVTIIGRSTTPFSNVFGPLIGKRLQKLHEEKGVQFILDAEVTELLGDEEDCLSEVVLNTGQTLRADLLLAGLGVLPCTDFIRGSNIKLNSKGYVPVNEYMKTNCKDVYAAGDIASFPLRDSPESAIELVNVGHWQMALHHGRTVALHILGRAQPIYGTAVPFFWSSMFGKSIRYCGHCNNFDDIIIHGSLDDLKFAAFICKGEWVKAVATLNYDPLAIQFAALLGQGKQLMKKDVKDDPKYWTKQL